MVKTFRNLNKLLTDVKEEFLKLTIPEDVNLSVGVAKKKIAEAFQSVKPVSISTVYPIWEKIKPDSFLASFKEGALDDQVMGQNFKGYVSMKDYLSVIEQKLIALTFVERTTLSDFFE